MSIRKTFSLRITYYCAKKKNKIRTNKLRAKINSCNFRLTWTFDNTRAKFNFLENMSPRRVSFEIRSFKVDAALSNIKSCNDKNID